MKLDTITKRIRLIGSYGDTGGGGTGNSLMKGLQNCDRIHTLSEYPPSTCINHGLNLTLSVPTIQCFGKGGLEKQNLLQYLHSVWNLTQQYEWEEFVMLWKSCSGKDLFVWMSQPVLTRWGYVGSAINWIIDKFEDIVKMAQAVINTQAAVSAKNSIAFAITSLTKEMLICAHIYFLKVYHNSFFIFIFNG